MATGLNRGQPGVNINVTNPENPTLEPKITILSCTQQKLWQFKEFLNFLIGAIVIFSNFSNK